MHERSSAKEGSKLANNWQWLKIKELGLRRFWSMLPLARVPFWNSGFLSHSQFTERVLLFVAATRVSVSVSLPMSDGCRCEVDCNSQ